MPDRELKTTIGLSINDNDFRVASEKIKQLGKIEDTASRLKGSAIGKDNGINRTDKELMQLAKHVNSVNTQMSGFRRNLQEQALGLGGGYRGLRAMRMFDYASDLSKASGGGLKGAMAVGGAALPIAGLLIAGAALEKVFTELRERGAEVSAAFTQIGGGKNLQETLVQGAKNEQDAAKIAGTANLSTPEVINMMNAVKNIYPIKQDQINSLFGSYSNAAGGNLKGMPTDTMANLILAGTDADMLGKTAGRLKSDMPNITQGQLSDMLIQMREVGLRNGDQNKYFSSIERIGRLRTEGVGFERNLALAGIIEKGGGEKMPRGVVTELLKYEKGDKTHAGDPFLKNLAANAVGNLDESTVPGALRAQAKTEQGSDFKDTKQNIQAFLDKNTDLSGSFDRLKRIVDDLVKTEESQLIQLENQKQTNKIKALTEAENDLVKAHQENDASIQKFTNTIDSAATEVEVFAVNIAGIFSNIFTNLFTNFSSWDEAMNALKPKAEDIGKPSEPKEAQPSGEKDATVKTEKHAAKTADNTGNIADILKRMEVAIKNTGIPLPPTSSDKKVK